MRIFRTGLVLMMMLVTMMMTQGKERERSSGTESRPWVGAVYFYWYEWDRPIQWGNWLGGIHNTPLYGYYDNRSLQDNFQSLLRACDWGVSHFFIDYWGAPWKGDDGEPRERTVLRAAEKVASLGYPIFVGYYQDGTNFAMSDFSLNISEKRDAYVWLKEYASSPVWTWMNGKPFQMVYGRNGLPQESPNDAAFRKWLKGIFQKIENLNTDWGTTFHSFDEISMDFSKTGPVRAFSIAFQFEMWKQSWLKLDQLIQKETGFPGLFASFDAGYAPFKGYGFEKFIRTFGGSHSYGGIFGPPHQMDAPRFLHAAIARKRNTIFFDHLKHRYFDWGIRVPGTAYPPDPFHYDRFWVGNLMRPLDGVLHLSWNEWWEGSNLEPSMEGGKTFCEKHLFYTTLWHLTYPSDRKGTTSDVGLLVNDWIFERGDGAPDDLYSALQGLRSAQIPFELILPSEVNDQLLSRYRIIVAPSGSVGLGYNRQWKQILPLLEEWVKKGKRTLIVSHYPFETIGSERGETTQPKRPSPVKGFNYFIDVGVGEDESVLITGWGERENWGPLPPTAFGAGSPATVRWTPSVGNRTSFLVPLLQGADCLLRWHGNAIWPNKVTIFLNGVKVAEEAVEPGWRIYQILLPASAIGSARIGQVTWQFHQSHIPGEKEPQKFAGEQRVCNFALDWIQVSTPDVAAGERKGLSWAPEETARFQKPKSGPFYARPVNRSVLIPKGIVLSSYTDGLPRDILVREKTPRGPSYRLIVNGLMTDDPYWWSQVFLLLGKRVFPVASVADGTLRRKIMAHIRSSGETDFLLVENRAMQTTRITFSVPQRPYPLSEMVALARDGTDFCFLNIPTSRTSGRIAFSDMVTYYSVYQITWCPLRVHTQLPTLFPGQNKEVSLEVENLLSQPINCQLQILSSVVSVQGDPVTVTLRPKEKRKLTLNVRIAPFADWGVKTIWLEAVWRDRQDRKAVFVRQLTIGRPSSVRCLTSATTAPDGTVTVANSEPTPYGDISWSSPLSIYPMDSARNVILSIEDLSGRTVAVRPIGNIAGDQSVRVPIRMPTESLPPGWWNGRVTLRWEDSRGHQSVSCPIQIWNLPRRLAGQKRAKGIIVHSPPPTSDPLPLFFPYPDPTLPNLTAVAGSGHTIAVGHDRQRKMIIVFPDRKAIRPFFLCDVGSDGDEDILLSGFSYRERWPGGVTVRWTPGDDSVTTLTLPCRPQSDHLLIVTGYSIAANRVSLQVNGERVGVWDITAGWKIYSQLIPASVLSDGRRLSVKLIYEKMIRPAEVHTGTTDKRACNLAIDKIQMVPAFEGSDRVVYLYETDAPTMKPPQVVRQGPLVRVDNGVIVLEWDERKGGTITQLISKKTGRHYGADGMGAGLGIFGTFDPRQPAVTSDRFVRDDIGWQRLHLADITVSDLSPGLAVVEVTGDGNWKGHPFRFLQRYRIFTGSPIVEVEASATPIGSAAPLPEGSELIVLESRFLSRYWTKTFPNFVGLGDQPPEVYGPVTHYGWRTGNFLPPFVTFFHPDDLDESLSLIVMEAKGVTGVRQGFWSEKRRAFAGPRQLAVCEVLSQPPSSASLRLFLVLHPGHHRHAQEIRDWLMAETSVILLSEDRSGASGQQSSRQQER